MINLSVISESQLKANQASNQGPVKQIANFMESSKGMIQTLTAIQKFAKLTNAMRQETGSAPLVGLTVLEARTGDAMSVIGIVTLPGLVKSVIKSISDLKAENRTPQELSRKTLKAVNGVANIIASCGSAILTVIHNSPLKNTMGVIRLASNSTEAALILEDLEKSSAMLRRAAAENAPVVVQTAILHSKRYAMLSAVKKFCAIAGAILGVAGLVATGALAIVLIVISLSSVIFGMAAHFYKETRPYEVIDFFQSRRLLH